jgi:hypothetical protein
MMAAYPSPLDASDCTQRMETICNGLAEAMGSERNIMILSTEKPHGAVAHVIHIDAVSRA